MALPTSGATGVARTLRSTNVSRPHWHVAVVEHLQRAAQQVADALAGAARRCVRSASQSPRRWPTCAPASRSSSTSWVRKLVCDELAERAADLVLAVRDDRRVRDRDAERMAEQGGDGEPVGERADHRRLGEGADVADPAVLLLLPAGDEEDDGDDNRSAVANDLHLA